MNTTRRGHREHEVEQKEAPSSRPFDNVLVYHVDAAEEEDHSSGRSDGVKVLVHEQKYPQPPRPGHSRRPVVPCTNEGPHSPRWRVGPSLGSGATPWRPSSPQAGRGPPPSQWRGG